MFIVRIYFCVNLVFLVAWLLVSRQSQISPLVEFPTLRKYFSEFHQIEYLALGRSILNWEKSLNYSI